MKEKLFLPICFALAIVLVGYISPQKNLQSDNPTTKFAITSLQISEPQEYALVTKPAPDFNLLDLEGNTVSLKELKGKVVVLDFWATWCAPCINSFPAMQKAVDLYKDDQNVKFLFINTWEQKKDPQKTIQQFLAKRGFDFQVLMDIKEPGSSEDLVVESYGVRGIPAKFIIDGQGMIRYHVLGFAGDDEEVIKELTEMIESAKEG